MAGGSPGGSGVGGQVAGRAWLFRHGIPLPVEEAHFALGMVRDLPRTMIPPGGAYDIQDYMTDQPGRLYKRGGTQFACSALGGSEVLIVGIACCEFPRDPRIVAIATDGAAARGLYDITTGTPAARLDLGGRQPIENPPFVLQDQTGTKAMLIITDGYTHPTPVPMRATLSAGIGSAISVGQLAGGAAPGARYSCMLGDSLVLANNDDHPNRLWFSAHGNPDNWNAGGTIGGSWVDTADAITGLATVAGVLIVFHRQGAERLIVKNLLLPVWDPIPPATPPVLTPLSGAPGCIDARSIVHGNGLVYFAHESGIYYTNGSAARSITTKPKGVGIASFWRQYVGDLDMSLGCVVAQGIYADDWLFTTVRHPSGVDFQLLCYLPTEAFVRTAPRIGCDMYATRRAPNMAIYGANGNISQPVRALNLTGVLAPAYSLRNDANGEPVLPYLETRMLGPGLGLKAYFDGYLSYDMRDGGDAPTLQLQIATGLEADSGYAAVAESPLPPTSRSHRQRFTVSKDTNSVQFALQQVNASSKTEIYAIDTSYHPYYAADGL
jgi:hypothetical protein